MTATPNAADQSNSTVQVPRYFYALGVLTGVNLLNYIDRQVFLPSLALKQIRVHLSDTEIGAIEATLLLSFTILAPLFGRSGDRRAPSSWQELQSCGRSPRD